MFLKNAWYVAANDHEIVNKPLARVLLGEPVVMYRQKDGKVIALGNPRQTDLVHDLEHLLESRRREEHTS